MSLLDEMKLLEDLPEGLPRGADPRSMVTGRLLSVDPGQGIALVSIGGGDGVWMPAQPAIYTEGGLVRVVRSALDGGKASFCQGPVTGVSTIAGGEVVTLDTGNGLLVVDTMGERVALPYIAGTYTVGDLVHVQRSVTRYGLPEIVLGRAGGFVSSSPSQPPSEKPDEGGALVTKTATILPTSTGSWRASVGRWNSWNENRYGGRTSLWQGNAYGSGSMKGLATYGNRITDLNAEEIKSIQVRVWRADSSDTASRIAVVQPSPHGLRPSGAPSSSGDTASSPGLTPGKSAWVKLPNSVLEGFRTGDHRGLCMVGADYLAVSGLPTISPIHADGMALKITYTKEA